MKKLLGNMKFPNTFLMVFVLALLLILFQKFGFSCSKPDGGTVAGVHPVEVSEFDLSVPPTDCFEYAESVTGFSAEALRGLAAIESDFRTDAIGDDGMSLGMFQLHSRWYEVRVEKWGEFDPSDPFESAVVAGLIMRENLAAFDGDLRMAVAAYRQGIQGVKDAGVVGRYADLVLNWRCIPEKMQSFSIFCGITYTEALQNGYKGTGTQATYTINDSFAAQISRRRSGGISD
jgi:hypothetical protein